MPQEVDPTHLAIAFFRSVIFDIILCDNQFDEEALKRWEFILRGGDVQEYTVTRRFQAIVEAKKRLRKPENISAFLIYRISHGSFSELHEEQNANGPHCIGCSTSMDIARREAMVKRIKQGLRLKHLHTLDCAEFVHTHLTQEEMNEFIGHELSFSYQEAKIEEIYEELSGAKISK
jgi:hypothetical protein